MSDAREISEIAWNRAIALIRENFGPLNDLSEEVCAVVWVTTYRACEMGAVAEQAGGTHGLLKNTLIGDRELMPALKEWTIRLTFLNKMIPIVRQQHDLHVRKADSQILIDCLKWNIVDAGEMSVIHRALARMFAKADSLYKQKIPVELFN